MCAEFDDITANNIKEAIKNYKLGQESIKTTNYFKLGKFVYPAMNIVKNAIELNVDIKNENLCNNLHGCKCILKKRIPNIIFLSEDK